MFRPLKLNDFLNEVVKREPAFKTVFLSNNMDGSILATNDWKEKTFICNISALWEDSNYIGQYKLCGDGEEHAEELGDE